MKNVVTGILFVAGVGLGCSSTQEQDTGDASPGVEPDGSAQGSADAGWVPACVAGNDMCTLATEQDYARDIAVDGTSVYWTVVGAGVVRRAPLGGGAASNLTTGQSTPMGIAVNAQAVFWTTQGTGPSFTNATVMSLPLGGTASSAIAQNQTQTEHMALTATNVFWVNQGTAQLTNGSIVTARLDGSNQSTLASGLTNANFVAADDSYAYFTTAGTAPDYADGAVWCVPVGGGPVASVASNQASAWSIVVDDKNVYWTDAVASGAVMSVPKGGGVPKVLAQGQQRPNILCLDDSFVYWTNYDAGTLVRTPKTGGGISTLVTGMTNPESCVVDATTVYLTTRGTGHVDGSVLRVPK